ncbi:cobalt transporter CbiM [Calderihabitans maritimus]|uniref:ABC-type Co2+ transport system, permease component n=1 Tax=Calderihabitans maritimus TaxID=1246530 RepID=A0A1Z5HUR9_9FIRM|nr:cobalt transporter CbiM [Calderihabitans maritimus]GAW93097.1 ABC-type Co2+ transport system, permease component [Calderihabitans maritimus]
MHIPDGVLPTSVCLGGYAAAGAVTWFSLRKISQKENPREGIPKASLLTAAFLVASWIHIPVPPASVHLVLNGLLGVVLGYYAFPAILIGLFFQAVMFQHGGLTTLGVNATVMGVPALLAYYLFRLRNTFGRGSRLSTGLFGFLAGAGGIGLAAVAVFVLLVTTIPAHMDVEAERASICALTLAHIPLMIIEGVFTAALALFLQRVKPELLEGES